MHYRVGLVSETYFFSYSRFQDEARERPGAPMPAPSTLRGLCKLSCKNALRRRSRDTASRLRNTLEQTREAYCRVRRAHQLRTAADNTSVA